MQNQKENSKPSGWGQVLIVFVAANQDLTWIFIWQVQSWVKIVSFTAVRRSEHLSQTDILTPSHSHVNLYRMIASLPSKQRQHISRNNPSRGVITYFLLLFFFLPSKSSIGNLTMATPLHSLVSVRVKYPYSLTKARQNNHTRSQPQPLMAKKVVCRYLLGTRRASSEQRASQISQALSAIWVYETQDWHVKTEAEWQSG